MDLRQIAFDYLFNRLETDIARLRLTEEGARQAQKLYEMFAGRFCFKPLILLMPNVHEQIAESLLDEDITTEEMVNLWVFDYVVGLSTYMDGVTKGGYVALRDVVMNGCRRYLDSASIPSAICERAEVAALGNPLVLLFFIMYDVILRYNEKVTLDVYKTKNSD